MKTHIPDGGTIKMSKFYTRVEYGDGRIVDIPQKSETEARKTMHIINLSNAILGGAENLKAVRLMSGGRQVEAFH